MPKNQWINNAQNSSPCLSRYLSANNPSRERLEQYLDRPLTPDDFHAFAHWDALLNDEAAFASALRRLRRLVFSTLIVRDINHLASLDEVMHTITQFADFAVTAAEHFAHRRYAEQYGDPIGETSKITQRLSVIAMGKMGGGELNVSSDIDLIFIYPENGETNGKRPRDNHDFFTKVGQKIIKLLNDITEDGQVFRVDMRLRPDGDSGPLVMSEGALEQYLIAQGREWERYAWIKARVITPHPNQIEEIIRPFVYRKYLDFNAYESMRTLHKMIRKEALLRQKEQDIKLGIGGIREIEFIAQIFQLIRGGKIKSLQKRGTQEILRLLPSVHLLEEEQSIQLIESYRFLRNIEHRLQYWDDAQTQRLPVEASPLQKLAENLNFATVDHFRAHLETHQQFVHQLFNQILGEYDEQTTMHTHQWDWQQCNAMQLSQFQMHQTDEVLRRLESLKNSQKYKHLSEKTQARFDQLLPQLLETAAHHPPAEGTFLRLLDLIETVLRRSSYLALLQEYPHTVEQLAHIVSQSSWMSNYLQRHPILLDELLDDQLLEKNQNWQEIEFSMENQMLECQNDIEEEMDILRHTQHAQIFRLSVQDLKGLWSIEAISDELSALSDLILRQALKGAWRNMPHQTDDNPAFAVIGYGKLGGKELGYTSDLDLVYLHDDNENSEKYQRLANRLTSWLTASTGAGILYDVDLRLRPNGDSGFAASSLEAFRLYQENQAWTWEHQALSRARFVAGDEKIGAKFEQIRRDILKRKRDISLLRQEIIQMREKMLPTHPPEENNIKYARGGVVDVEFIVQFLVLAYAHQYDDLTQNLGNIALLKISAEHGLIDPTLSQKVQNAYRESRRIQHNARVRDEVFVPHDESRAHFASVRALWKSVFEQDIG